MNVELSLDTQNNSAQEAEAQSRPEEIQAISGSQIACAFTSLEQANTQHNHQSSFQVAAVSMAAVFAVASIYLVFVLVL